MSYVEAATTLVGATVQWLLIGRWLERHAERRAPFILRHVHRWAGVFISVVIATTLVVAPVINQRSRTAGLKHGAISFR